MDRFPIFLDLSGRPALVVGGGAAALSKARLLAGAGAQVTVVAPQPDADLAALARVVLTRRAFRADDVAGKAIVVGASGDDAVDRAVSDAARAAGIPVNVVDRPDISTFIVPAIVDRSPLVVAISTGGAAPVLARTVRSWLEARLPARLGRLAAFADSFRGAVRATIPQPLARRRLWERVIAGPIGARVMAGDEAGARERMLALVNGPAAGVDADGFVSLVGAGPGDPELLTLRALRALEAADVVVHDRLVGDEVLALARREARRIDVGKAPGRHTLAQDAIGALLVRLARDGHRVVRLKGGDPFVFGRGGEEAEVLSAAGIAYEIVPGITAAVGCAAAAGIPLTHRDHASAVTLVTGQGRDGALPDHDWVALARGRQTLVVYMGVATAGLVARRLLGHGMRAATPVAVIENGTRPEQRVLAGTLADLPALAAGAAANPAIVVIGDVAAYARADADLSAFTPAPRLAVAGR
ncbi:MAG: siroheme synthase CysG [Alphaproteobacteria bacterium]